MRRTHGHGQRRGDWLWERGWGWLAWRGREEDVRCDRITINNNLIQETAGPQIACSPSPSWNTPPTEPSGSAPARRSCGGFWGRSPGRQRRRWGREGHGRRERGPSRRAGGGRAGRRAGRQRPRQASPGRHQEGALTGILPRMKIVRPAAPVRGTARKRADRVPSVGKIAFLARSAVRRPRCPVGGAGVVAAAGTPITDLQIRATTRAPSGVGVCRILVPRSQANKTSLDPWGREKGRSLGKGVGSAEVRRGQPPPF